MSKAKGISTIINFNFFGDTFTEWHKRGEQLGLVDRTETSNRKKRPAGLLDDGTPFYHVEKFLKTKKITGLLGERITVHWVKWKYWPSTSNSWIADEDVIDRASFRGESDEELGESSGASSVNEVGAVVLAKCNGYPEWPALVVDSTEVPQNVLDVAHGSRRICIQFFPDGLFAWKKPSELRLVGTRDLDQYRARRRRTKDLNEGLTLAAKPKTWARNWKVSHLPPMKEQIASAKSKDEESEAEATETEESEVEASEAEESEVEEGEAEEGEAEEGEESEDEESPGEGSADKESESEVEMSKDEERERDVESEDEESEDEKRKDEESEDVDARDTSQDSLEAEKKEDSDDEVEDEVEAEDHPRMEVRSEGESGDERGGGGDEVDENTGSQHDHMVGVERDDDSEDETWVETDTELESSDDTQEMDWEAELEDDPMVDDSAMVEDKSGENVQEDVMSEARPVSGDKFDAGVESQDLKATMSKDPVASGSAQVDG
ncbi:hypothetical protein D9757_014754 [Collybiopsis confluens]|uniref:PWWP domain-containing protein n=1 Tax=Collybiopsis confluens TaxID=2823264 RepID=A0A8H5C9F5_9AGAR|nr:hypothetical protein D9757_014754 [Collybiopsis confluens]